MFGSLGVPEILFILVLALLVFGPRRLPELGRTIGRAMGEFRRASNDLRRTLNNELALEDESPRRPHGAPAPPARPRIGASRPGAASAAAAAGAPPVPRQAEGTEPRGVAEPETGEAGTARPAAEAAAGESEAGRDEGAPAEPPPIPPPPTELV